MTAVAYIKCADGRCVLNETLCDVPSGCLDPQLPAQCSNGTCVSRLEMCYGVCGTGTKRCPDGTCKAVCVCTNTTMPIACEDGSCAVKSEYCPCAANKTKCWDYTCMADKLDCSCPYGYIR